MHSGSAKVQMRESNFSDYSLYTSMQTHSDKTRAVGGRCFRIAQFIPPQVRKDFNFPLHPGADPEPSPDRSNEGGGGPILERLR